jgi:hypothetical protein
VVVGEEKEPPAPPSSKATTTPATALPCASLAFTFTGEGNCETTGTRWELPAEIDNVVGRQPSQLLKKWRSHNWDVTL